MPRRAITSAVFAFPLAAPCRRKRSIWSGSNGHYNQAVSQYVEQETENPRRPSVHLRKGLVQLEEVCATNWKAGNDRVISTPTGASLFDRAQGAIVMSETDRMIGPVRLVYASFDDGMVHRMNPTRWRSASGAPWPAKTSL
jgi:hypothetical protein